METFLAPQPTQPWHQDHKKEGGGLFPRQNVKANAVARQHRADPAKGLGELRQVAPSIGLGWARVQATSRGGHGDKAHYSRGVLYGAKALTSNRVLPHCEGRTDVTGSEAVENKVSTGLLQGMLIPTSVAVSYTHLTLPTKA